MNQQQWCKKTLAKKANRKSTCQGAIKSSVFIQRWSESGAVTVENIGTCQGAIKSSVFSETDSDWFNKKYNPGAAIQRRGPILAWIVILSVYDADTIAIDLSLSVLIS